MYKKLILALILVMLISQFAIPAVFAAGEPTGSCAPGFMLVIAMEHDEHHHQHVGTDADLNADGYICMMPVTSDGQIHVHVDNNLP